MKEKSTIVLLSVGSYARRSDLVYSQMLKLGDTVSESGEFNVQSLIYLPILSCLKRLGRVFTDVKEIKENTKHSVRFGLVFLRWGGAVSFYFRKILIKHTVSHLESRLLKILERNTLIVIHCRNYYSADVALRLKSKYEAKIKVVFDTRGLMPFEAPYVNSLGSILFGPFLEWEHDLVKRSDRTLVQAINSKKYLALLHGANSNVRFLPIAGFPKSYKRLSVESRFENAWKKKKILYVGSLGHWNDAELLFGVFSEIATAFNGEVSFVVATNEVGRIPRSSLESNLDIQVISVPYDSIHEIYLESLALIVAGSTSDEFFSQANNRLNYFSTKAVEALSLGVPLLVNSNLAELADFVSEKNCGQVISMERVGNKSSSIISSLNVDRTAWLESAKNAAQVGQIFETEAVHGSYKKIWREL